MLHAEVLGVVFPFCSSPKEFSTIQSALYDSVLFGFQMNHIFSSFLKLPVLSFIGNICNRLVYGVIYFMLRKDYGRWFPKFSTSHRHIALFDGSVRKGGCSLQK